MTKEKLEELIKQGATRSCKCCNKTLPVTDFHIKADKDPNNYRFNSPCKKCANANRNVNHYKAYYRKIKYNLTDDEYNKKLKEQNYCCAICGIYKDVYKKDFSVDHNHLTGQIRGLLCTHCNSGIGFFKERTTSIKKAIEYLNKYSIA